MQRRLTAPFPATAHARLRSAVAGNGRNVTRRKRAIPIGNLAYVYQMRNILLRPMKLDDCSEVSRIVRESFRWAAEKEKWPAQEIDKYVQGRGSQEAIRAQFDEYRFWVTSTAGRIIGLVAVEGNEITKLFVDPSAHRHGIGKKLFDEAERVVVQDGHDELAAGAVFDSAIPFYEAVGMFIVGRKFDILGKSEGRNVMLMRKSLSK
jgi:ribosomal protein S18 acetylase RimI-like enzyme